MGFGSPEDVYLQGDCTDRNATRPPRNTGAEQGFAPSRACLAVPASTARVTGAADGKHRDAVGVSYLSTHRGLYLIMLSAEWE